MKKLLTSIMVFIFSPIISAIKVFDARKDVIDLEVLKFLKAQAQLLTVISRKATMPLLMTARGMVINMMQYKRFRFECIWDHVYNLKFDLNIDGSSLDTFSFNLEKIANDEAIESKEDKAVIAFTKKFLLQNSFFTNGGNIKVSIVDHIAANACQILMMNLPHREMLVHDDLDVICYSAILNTMKPFYDKEQAVIVNAALPTIEEEKEQPNIFSINPEKESE